MKGNVKSLMLIEDDPDDQDLFEMALSQVDASVVIQKASDGLDALEKLNTSTFSRPDLIVLDINMPRMNGKEFMAELMNDQRLHSIPVVLYSTTSESKYVNEILSLGARSFFKKPDTFTSLCQQIKSALFPQLAN